MANYHAKRLALESIVVSAGRRMDRILDSLDDREDSLPESWIDDLESIEAEFAGWVMQAERRTVENEWRRLSNRSNENEKPGSKLSQPELAQNKDIARSTNTHIPPAVKNKITEISSAESLDSVDEVDSSEPASQARIAPFQIGRAPMETIVEEMGSPFDRPLSRIAGNIISTVAERTTPDSPSPLPCDKFHARDALASVPVMQLDDECDNTPANPMRDTLPDDSRGDVGYSDFSIKLSPVEDSIHLPEQQIQGLPITLEAETPVSLEAPTYDLDICQDTPEALVDASSTAEYVEYPPPLETPKGECSLASTNLESFVGLDEPQDEIKDQEVTPQAAIDISVVEPSPLEPESGNESSTDSTVETTVSSQGEGLLRLPAIELELDTTQEAVLEKMQPQVTTTTLAELTTTIPGSGGSMAQGSAHTISTDLTTTKPPIAAQPKSEETASPRPSVEKSTPLAEESVSREINFTQTPPSIQEPARISALPEHNKSSEITELLAAFEEPQAIANPGKEAESSQQSENSIPLPAEAIKVELEEKLELSAEISEHAQSTPVEEEPVATGQPLIEAALSPVYTPKAPKRCEKPPGDNLASLPNLFIPHDARIASPEPHHIEETEEQIAPKKPLDSPIKLSKARPGRLDLDEHKSKTRVRRTSKASNGSLSDYPSLVSSPEIPEPRTASSNGTPLLVEMPPHFPADYEPSGTVRRSDHTLREERLLRLDSQKPSPRENFAHNRALSLPLQRFINERLDMNYETGSGTEEDVFASEFSGYKKKKAPAERRLKSRSATSPGEIKRLDGQHLASTREESPGPDSDGSIGVQRAAQESSKKTLPWRSGNATSAGPVSNKVTTRIRNSLTAQPSLESIGPYTSDDQPKRSKPILNKTKSRSSSLSKQFIRPKDHMDEKINSILTTLPGRIHLVPADQDDDAMSVASSVPLRRERLRSDSPQGTPSRSFTPTPSLTLRPAAGRRRHSHAPEESSMKLYHLHRGGKSAPTKLFVRTVGETGERLMVRVGGGWADLAEYLREYAIHHGRRHVSETPRVEVEGLPSRDSPSYSPPGSRVPSGTGRPVPSRPRSVLSNRPASSLAVRKTRRSSNVSDFADLRTANSGDALNVSFSPMSSAFPGRRMSVSSNVSAGAVSSVSEFRHGSPGASAMPLGLAGPKPRAKHAAITPEGEAWVEDVLGQARRSSSLRPFKYTIPPPENDSEAKTPPVPTLPKSRSISDIGKAGSSKRVALRGLR
ncbi:hypothetical protein BJY04DRAFT_183835 [Aspergillus karnatakaensis]|uniref:GAS2 domain protein n=1 Tax=Aspergillus karnatakaensis TaxID=1810916 RepID=UPI003CCDB0DD